MAQRLTDHERMLHLAAGDMEDRMEMDKDAQLARLQQAFRRIAFDLWSEIDQNKGPWGEFNINFEAAEYGLRPGDLPGDGAQEEKMEPQREYVWTGEMQSPQPLRASASLDVTTQVRVNAHVAREILRLAETTGGTVISVVPRGDGFGMKVVIQGINGEVARISYE